MSEKKSRFVVLCQHLLACATVAALAAPAGGVVSLDIVSPTPAEAGRTEPSAAPALVASEPVEPEIAEVPIRGVERAGLQALTPRRSAQANRAKGLTALTAPTDVDGFATVGVTWNAAERIADGEIAVSVRTRDDGVWSGWQAVEYDADHGPDPDSEEGRRARQGTEAFAVGAVDDVQVKIATADGEVPVGAELVVIDPQPTSNATMAAPAIDTGALGAQEPAPVGGDAALTAGTVTPRPRIFSRAQWGADERLRDKSALKYYEVHAGFVHHTVSANGYTRDQVPALLRGIYAYHTKSRGWSDVGYNFLVDRFGRIWEGRYGGVDRPVVGAHTLGYNEYSFAMSAIGNFDNVAPSSAMLNAYGRLFAWKLSLHGVSASSPRQRVGSRYFAAINGHRDAGQTACPGRYLYAQLRRIRTLAAGAQRPFTDRARSANLAGSPWADLVVRQAGTNKAYVVRTGGQTDFRRRRRAALGWAGMDLIAPSSDLTGDGVPDVMARDAATKRTFLYPGTRRGRLGASVLDNARFDDVDQMVGAADMNGDGHNDIVARDTATRRLFLYPGNSRAGFGGRQVLAWRWDYDVTGALGDFDGDGRNDLLGRKAGELFVVPGTAGGLAAPVRLPGRWGHYDVVTGAGDVSNDGNRDIVVRVRRDKLVYVVPGDGRGGLGPRLGPFTQFKDTDFIAVAGEFTGGPGADLVVRNTGGRLFTVPNNGRKNVEAVTDAGLLLTGVDTLLNVGDWNNDGYGDVMTRMSGTGNLVLHPGDGTGRFRTPVVAARGWGAVGLLAAVGDMTGDGYPDLMGQPGTGAMRIYPGNGATGFRPSYVAHSAIAGNRHTGLGLWNADGAPDSLVRRSDGSLFLYPGNGPGGLVNGTRIGAGANRYDWFQSPGDLTGDGRPDVVARDSVGGALWVLPGGAVRFGLPRLLATGFAGYDLSS